MKTVLEKVNNVLKIKPLIYFSREVERALGLEDKLENYHICCVEYDYIVDLLISRGISVFCAEKEGLELKSLSTTTLLSHPKVKEWIAKISNGKGFYAMTFYPSEVVHYKIKELGGILLNNTYDLNLKFEDKISSYKLLKEDNIPVPHGVVINISETSYEDLIAEFTQTFVIQSARGHTGSGTFIIRSEDQFENVKSLLDGNEVKICELISGDTYTLNVCVGNSSNFINGLQYQITGIEELTPEKGSTVGNDFVHGPDLSSQVKHSILIVADKIAELMRRNGYLGLFGIDLIVSDTQIYIIEINARQTANIPLQTKLERLQLHQAPLLLLHIATFLKIDIGDYNLLFEHITGLIGAQLFLRAFSNGERYEGKTKSGIYKIPKTDTFKLDDLFNRNGYSLLDLKDNELVLLSKSSSIKNKFDELARVQLNQGIMVNGNVDKRFIAILNQMRKTM